MKSFLAFLVTMGIIVTLSDADCWRKIHKPEEAKNVLFATDSSYNTISYNKDECKLVFNKERCDYDVVQKDDPTKPCRSGYSRAG
uniref:uncharacterized protein n=1 Tax=Lonchura striata TaxID=40157 RepID=UPI0012930D00|nr:uncharacterized protein LOC110475131 [Lonchura striata domestica]